MSVWPVKSAGVTTPTSNRISLASGETMLLGPGAGVWQIQADNYVAVQYLDPVMGIWTRVGGAGRTGGSQLIYSDGANYRIANQTGCAVGALLTTAGSGYTSAPTVTASAGNSIWRAVIGGAVSATVSIINGGANYTYAPTVIFSAPPVGGVQASGYCTVSAGAVATVVVTNQGAGYSQAPTISFQNDPREGLNGVTFGYGATALTSLTGTGTVTAVLCVDHGTGGLTSVPTLAFSGGGGSAAAATAIMCWSITGYTVTTAGTGWTTKPLITAFDNFPATSPAYTNPATQSLLVATAPAQIIGAVSAGAITATGQVVLSGGVYTSTPTVVLQNTGELITATALLAATMGGQTATVYAQQI